MGRGESSVAGMIEFCRPIVERGAAFLGAFDGEEVLGLAVVDGSFEPKLAWCAFLYVSRRHLVGDPGHRLPGSTVGWFPGFGLAHEPADTPVGLSFE